MDNPHDNPHDDPRNNPHDKVRLTQLSADTSLLVNFLLMFYFMSLSQS